MVSCGSSEADSHALCQMKCFRGEWADNDDSWNEREKGFLCGSAAACIRNEERRINMGNYGQVVAYSWWRK